MQQHKVSIDAAPTVLGIPLPVTTGNVTADVKCFDNPPFTTSPVVVFEAPSLDSFSVPSTSTTIQESSIAPSMNTMIPQSNSLPSGDPMLQLHEPYHQYYRQCL